MNYYSDADAQEINADAQEYNAGTEEKNVGTDPIGNKACSLVQINGKNY